MSASVIAKALAHIDTRLDSMARYPREWGWPEALELQAIHLLEFRSMIGRPKAFEANPREVRDLWDRAIAWQPPGRHDKAIVDLIRLARERLPLEGA